MPEAAAVPANPMKCPEPILLANNEAPTWEQNRFLGWWYFMFYIYVVFFLTAHLVNLWV